MVLAATLAPLGAMLERRGWKRGRAALGATAGGFLGVLVIIGLTLVSLAGPASEMIDQAVAGAGSANSSAGGNAGPLVSLIEGFGAGILRTIAAVLSSLSSLAVVVLLATLLTFYFMRDGEALWAGVPRARRTGSAIPGGRGWEPGVRRPQRLHDRDRARSRSSGRRPSS